MNQPERILIAKMKSNKYQWNPEEPYRERKIRAVEVEIYYTNDAYLIETITYIDGEYARNADRKVLQIIGLQDLNRTDVFATQEDVLKFINEKDGLTYRLVLFDKKYFNIL